jgi:Protein tyrosine and serine/threonine kinase/Right handed beta helix region
LIRFVNMTFGSAFAARAAPGSFLGVGILLERAGRVLFENCAFRSFGALSQVGGGVSIGDVVHVRFSQCTFHDNWADGGAAAVNCGPNGWAGMTGCLPSSAPLVEFDRCSFRNNRDKLRQFEYEANDVSVLSKSTVVFDDCRFERTQTGPPTIFEPDPDMSSRVEVHESADADVRIQHSVVTASASPLIHGSNIASKIVVHNTSISDSVIGFMVYSRGGLDEKPIVVSECSIANCKYGVALECKDCNSTQYGAAVVDGTKFFSVFYGVLLSQGNLTMRDSLFEHCEYPITLFGGGSVKNTVVRNSNVPAVYAYASRFDIVMENIVVGNATGDNFYGVSPFMVYGAKSTSILRNVTIEDSVSRDQSSFPMAARVDGKVDVAGFRLVRSYGTLLFTSATGTVNDVFADEPLNGLAAYACPNLELGGTHQLTLLAAVDSKVSISGRVLVDASNSGWSAGRVCLSVDNATTVIDAGVLEIVSACSMTAERGVLSMQPKMRSLSLLNHGTLRLHDRVSAGNFFMHGGSDARIELGLASVAQFGSIQLGDSTLNNSVVLIESSGDASAVLGESFTIFTTATPMVGSLNVSMGGSLANSPFSTSVKPTSVSVRFLRPPVPAPTSADQVSDSASSASETAILIIAIALGVCFVIGILGGYLVARRRSKRVTEDGTELSSKYIIDYDDLVDLRPIGAGAFGVVSKGLWRSREINVAVKQLNGAVDDDALADFHQEAATLLNLKPHNHIVQVLGIVEDPPCIVLEFMKRGSLLSFLRKSGAQPEDRLFSFALGVARGILHLHAEGMCHGDLSARNVLLSDSLVPKVADFGLSIALGDSSDDSDDEHSPLAIRWAAPEQHQGAKRSAATDCWSFGVFLFEVCTAGAVPYAELSNEQVVAKVSSGSDDANPGVPVQAAAALGNLMRRCWSVSPQNRPPFRTIVTELRRHVGADSDSTSLSEDGTDGANYQTPDGMYQTGGSESVYNTSTRGSLALELEDESMYQTN